MSGDQYARVLEYERRRYSSLDQRVVHGLETRLVWKFVDELCQPGDSLLDMPCGYGRFTDGCRERGLQVFVGDRKHAMLYRTRENVGGRIPAIRLDSAALPYRTDSFDVVMCIRLLQHVHEPAKRLATLREIARVARRGAVLTTYLTPVVHGAVHRLRRLKRLTRHTERTLRSDLEAAGLTLLAMEKPLPVVHAQTVLKVAPVP